MTALRDRLQKYFGIDDFRPGQRSAIEAILKGRDVLAIWPTGAGKSLTYQLSAQLLPHLTLVVTPLISLMLDQVRRLREQGFTNVACLSSTNGPALNRQVIYDLIAGKLKILFLTPERLNSDQFLIQIRDLPISLLTIDEAHCICQWGHDFRPEYMRLGKAINALQPRSILALTATAPPEVQRQIALLLGLRSPHHIRLSLRRSNLHYTVKKVPILQWRDIALQHLYRRRGLPAVVYANQRQECENMARYLNKYGLKAHHYHAGMDPELRNSIQKRFLENDLQVIVATTAFGMGVDKPDVRQVIHMAPSGSIEEYYQESGRAGRDRQEAHCLLMCDKIDLERSNNLLSSELPDNEVAEKLHNALHLAPALELRQQFVELSDSCWEQILQIVLGYERDDKTIQIPKRSLEKTWAYLNYLQERKHKRALAMKLYIESEKCRYREMLDYFGEQSYDDCGRCDNCLKAINDNSKHSWKRLWCW